MKKEIVEYYCDWCENKLGPVKSYKLQLRDIVTDDVGEFRGRSEFHYCSRCGNQLLELLVKKPDIITPKAPLHQKYNSTNFETVGECPNCGLEVYDSISGGVGKCPNCGQKLDW